MSNAPPTPAGNKNWFVVSIVLACVLVLGVAGAYTMQATDQAAFCGGCHIMGEAALTHSISGHAKLACNECHAPYNLAAKLPFKAVAGTSDVLDTLRKNYPDVIHAEKKHKDVIQANCVRCHAVTLQNVAMDAKASCTECHRSVPHRGKAPISQRKVADG